MTPVTYTLTKPLMTAGPSAVAVKLLHSVRLRPSILLAILLVQVYRPTVPVRILLAKPKLLGLHMQVLTSVALLQT